MIKVAVIGAGQTARAHIEAFLDIKSVALLGIMGRTRLNSQKMAAAYSIPFVSDSITELYHLTRADIVVICVPILSSAAVSKAAAEFPWKILVEKPLGLDIHQSRNLADFFKRKDANVFVALNRRHYSSTKIAHLELEGEIGPRLIQVQDQQSLAVARKAGHPDAVVKNWMYANSIHLIDYIRMFGRGKIIKIQRQYKWSQNNPFLVAATISFESGDIALYNAAWDRPGRWAVTVTSLSKQIKMSPLEKIELEKLGCQNIKIIEESTWDKGFKPGFRQQAQAIVEFAKKGSNVGLVNYRESLEVMELVAAIYDMT